MRKQAWPIRIQLISLVLAVAIPLLSLHGLTIYTAAHQAREQASLSALSLAQLAATEIRQFFQETEALLAQVTQRPLIRAVDPSRCDSFLADLYAVQPQFATMFVADAAGQIICSATSLMTGSGSPPSVADQSWFQSISHTHAFTVGSVQLDRLHGRWDSVLAYPILNEADQLVGVLGVPIDLTRYQLSLNRVTLPAGAVITLLDAAGVVIARSLDPEKWIGHDTRDAEIVATVLANPAGQGQARGVDGVERIYGFITVAGAGWHVYAGIPTAVAFAPVREVILRDSLLSLIVVVLVVLLARWVSRQIELPIGSLAQASRAAAAGLETHVPVEGPREIAVVAEQFNHMLAAQAATTAALKLSEERFRHTFEQAAVGIAHISPTGRFLRFNQRFVDIIGYAQTELLHHTFQDITCPDDLEIDVAQFQQLLAEEIQTYTIEKRYVRQDESLVWVNLTVSLVRQSDGAPDYLIKVIEDITPRKQAEEELRQVYRALTVLSEANQILVRMTDEANLLQRVCDLMVKKGGYRLVWVGFAEQNEARRVLPVAQAGFDEGYLDKLDITWADVPRGRGPTGTAIRTGQAVVVRDILSDPAYIPWRAEAIQRGYASSIALPLLAGGQTLGALNIYAAEPEAFAPEEVKLLTELADDLAYGLMVLRSRVQLTQTQEALQQSEERYRQVVISISDHIYVSEVNAAGRFFNRYISPHVEKLTGHPQAAFLADWSFWRSLIHPDDQAVVAGQIEQLNRGQSSEGEYRLTRADGQLIWVRDSARVESEGPARIIYGVVSDITERKQTEEALRESEERFRATFEQAAVGIAHVSPEGRWLRVNQKLCGIAGYTYQELLTKSFQDITYPDDLDVDLNSVRQVLADEIKTYSMEKRYFRKDGSIVWINLTVSLVRETTGEPKYFISVVEDITKRKQAEESLRESEERYRNLLEVAPVGIAVHSEGKIVFTNPAGARLLGAASEEQIVGRSVVDIIHPDGLKAAQIRIQRMLAGEQGLYPVEDTYLKLDGTPLPVEVMATALPYQGNLAVQVIVTDITARKQAEAALRLARERLETLSHQLLEAQEMERRRLARELHDEIGQSLSMVKIDLHMIQQLLQPTDLAIPLHESVEMVERALQQVRALSVELRPSLLDDLGLIPALRWYVDRQAQRGKFTAHFAADPLPGRLAPELETVCFRLVQEALTNVLRYAQAGRVEVELTLDEAELHLAIRDDGVGFDASEALVGAVQGGSLGLLGMQERAALIGGWLEITSAPGYGAEIRANLPLKYAASAEGEE